MGLGDPDRRAADARRSRPTPGSSSPYVMAAQALSGIAKDLTKMSSKSAVKLVVPEDEPGTLYRWVAILTGSKNALKGVGFFLGGLLLTVDRLPDGDDRCSPRWSRSRSSCTVPLMRGGLGRADAKAKFRHMFSNNRAVNVLAAARIFLFASRDVWFVVGLPVFLRTRARLELLGGRHLPGGLGDRLRDRAGVGAADRARAQRRARRARRPHGDLARLRPRGASRPAIAIALSAGVDPTIVLVVGLIVFGVVFALNSRRPLVPDPRLRRRRQGRDERRLLLHGERRRAPGRHDPLGPALPVAGARGVPLGLGADARRRGRCLCGCRQSRGGRRALERWSEQISVTAAATSLRNRVTSGMNRSRSLTILLALLLMCLAPQAASAASAEYGSLDADFGSGGTVGDVRVANPTALVIQQDRKILIAGGSPSAPYAGVIARVNRDGTPDKSFGVDGFVSTPGGGPVYDMKLLGDQRIATVREGSRVMVFNPDGKLDAGFGTGGVLDFGTSEADFKVASIGAQAGSKLLISGSPGGFLAAHLMRVDRHGVIDPSFGDAGVATLPLAGVGGPGLSAIASTPQGDILLGISTTHVVNGGASGLAVVKFTGSGRRVLDFGQAAWPGIRARPICQQSR